MLSVVSLCSGVCYVVGVVVSMFVKVGSGLIVVSVLVVMFSVMCCLFVDGGNGRLSGMWLVLVLFGDV